MFCKLFCLFAVFSFFVTTNAEASQAEINQLMAGLYRSGTAEDQNSRQLFWKTEGENAKVYLFGSMHFGMAEFYPFNDEIESAFRNSEYLVVEVNTMCETFMPEVVKHMRDGFLPPGVTLKDKLSPEVYEMLARSMSDMGLDIERFSNYKPWLMSLTLSSLKIQALGYSAEMGVENYFFNLLEERTVLELESVETQMKNLALLDGEELLAYTIVSDSEMKKMLDEMTRAWMSGDSLALTEIVLQDYSDEIPGYELIYESMIKERNRDMTQKIAELLGTEGTYFVVVGAGHFLGPDSIIEMLLEEGLEVNRVTVVQ
ncbi:hypothetical protein CHISP_1163 [Chitinispirillum alkaliphilum]|nr:hypothetical protein CHISP_1163 [Chitinispirillum alkaliphilum]